MPASVSRLCQVHSVTNRVVSSGVDGIACIRFFSAEFRDGVRVSVFAEVSFESCARRILSGGCLCSAMSGTFLISCHIHFWAYSRWFDQRQIEALLMGNLETDGYEESKTSAEASTATATATGTGTRTETDADGEGSAQNRDKQEGEDAQKANLPKPSTDIDSFLESV